MKYFFYTSEEGGMWHVCGFQDLIEKVVNGQAKAVCYADVVSYTGEDKLYPVGGVIFDLVLSHGGFEPRRFL